MYKIYLEFYIYDAETLMKQAFMTLIIIIYSDILYNFKKILDHSCIMKLCSGR
jgi:hypothetical protein